MPMLFHKTLGGVRQTCAGAVGLMAKAGRLPIIARLALATGHLTDHDIQQSAALVVDPPHRCADLPDDEHA